MFKLLSGVLQLGNTEFMTAGGAQITTKQGQFACKVSKEILNVDKCIAVMYSIFVHLLVVSNASELLGLDAFQLSEVLTQRSIILRGEEICSPLTIEQVKHTHTHIQSSPLVWSPTQSHTHLNTPSGFSFIWSRLWIPETLLPWRYIPSVSPGSSSRSIKRSKGRKTLNPLESSTSLALRTLRSEL